jgi:hypothetical protein
MIWTVFSRVRVARSLVFCVVCCRSLFVLSFFIWSIVLSVLLRLTYSRYSFGIFTLFLPKIINPHQGINTGLRQRCPVVVVIIICKFERENVKKRGHMCGSSWYQDLLLLIFVALTVHCDVVFCFLVIDLFSCYRLVRFLLTFSCQSIVSGFEFRELEAIHNWICAVLHTTSKLVFQILK